MIQLDNFCFGYEDKEWTLHTAFPEGAVVGVAGENGSGKSTFMRSIAGLEAVKKGKVWLDTISLTALTIVEKSDYINYFHTTTDYFQELYVQELIHIGSRVTSTENEHKLSQDMNIHHLLNKKVKAISDGELQRVGLTRALVNTKKINLYDEPTVFLDYRHTAIFQQQLMNCAAGNVHFVSSHDFRFLSAVCTHFLFFKSGNTIIQLPEKATSDEIYRILTQ